MKLAVKYKIGKKGIKLVLKKVKKYLRKKRYKIGGACWQRLGKCALSLSPGQEIQSRLHFPRPEFNLWPVHKIPFKPIFSFYFFYHSEMCLNYFFYLAYFFLLFHLFCSISLIYSMFFFLHAVWDKYCQEDSLCTKCAI